jgi:ribosomal protein L36
MKYGVGLKMRCAWCRVISRFGIKMRICSKSPNHKKSQSSSNKRKKRSIVKMKERRAIYVAQNLAS